MPEAGARLVLPSQQGCPLVIAHRGAKGYLPENTLPAYQLALEQGADMLEIDLHRSRDGAIPIRHDETLEGFGREGEIADLSLDELRALARESHEKTSQGANSEPIPTLQQALDAFGDKLPFNLEIKAALGGTPYPGLQQAALAEVVERGLLDRTLFSSFFDPALAELRALSSDVRLAVLVDPRAPHRVFERAAEVQAEAINPHFFIAKRELVDEAHQRGLAVYVYTVDDPDHMQDLFDIGVDGIFSNYPDRLRRVVDSRIG